MKREFRYCTGCGARLKQDCPKAGPRSPCQECVGTDGHRECRQAGCHNYCLCCSRDQRQRYFQGLGNTARERRVNELAQAELKQREPLQIGPVELLDCPNGVIVRWEPREKGEVAVVFNPKETRQAARWFEHAAARKGT